MPTRAGEMTQTPPGDPQWVACNGKYFYVMDAKAPKRTAIPGTPSTGDRRDWLRRVGNQGRERGFGMNGFMIGVPFDPSGTWYISLADDNTETTIPNAPTPAKPPAGVK